MAFKGWIALGMLLLFCGTLLQLAHASMGWILASALAGAGIVLYQLARMKDRVWALDAAREVMRMKEQEDAARASWQKVVVRNVPFREQGVPQKIVILFCWAFAIACLFWTAATALGLDFARPAQWYVDLHLKNDPAKIIVDRVFVTFISLCGSVITGVIALTVFRQKWEERPSDEGWKDIVFVKEGKGDIVH